MVKIGSPVEFKSLLLTTSSRRDWNYKRHTVVQAPKLGRKASLGNNLPC